MTTLRSIARGVWHSAWLFALLLAIAAVAAGRPRLGFVFAAWAVVGLAWLLAVRLPAIARLFSPAWRRDLPWVLIWLGIVLTPLASPGVRTRLFGPHAVVGPPVDWSADEQQTNVADVVQVADTDWPCWRGPTGQGIALQDPASAWKVPAEWSPTKNIVWKSPLKGYGHASPIVVGDRVYLSTADEQAQGLLCFDAKEGTMLWKRRILSGRPISIHAKNSHASPTPAANERLVCVAFLADVEGKKGIWVTALDHAGRTKWQRLAGEFTNVEGYGASPAVHGDTLFVAADGLDGGFVTALAIDSGEVLWRTPRDLGVSYSSPIVGQTGGRLQLILAGATRVTSYDPSGGAELWYCTGLPTYSGNTASWDDTRVYATGGSPTYKLVAIDSDGSGDITDSKIAWETNRGVPYIPSMLLHKGRLFAVNDQGIMTCMNAANGKRLWQKRLGGNVSSSPVLVDDLLYIAGEEGPVFVVRAADKFELVATNDLGEPLFATPAVAGGRMYLRGQKFLYCIAAPNSPADRDLTTP